MALITPGPALRVKIDKIAEKLAVNPPMAAKLLNSARREEFGFLVEGHEFYPYYLSRVTEYRANPPAPKPAAAPGAAATASKPSPKPEGAAEEEAKPLTALQKALAASRAQGAPLSDPHPDKYSLPMTGPNSTLPPLELDVMRAAAAYAAKVGGDFNEQLLARHGRDPVFDFLRREHPRHRCFQSLCSAYKRVLDGPDEAALERDCGEACIDAVRTVCEEKKAFEEAELARKRAAQLSEPELRQRLVWSTFSVIGSFSMADLAITAPQPKPAAATQQAAAAPVQATSAAAAAGGEASGGPMVIDDYVAEGRTATRGPQLMVDEATGAAITADAAGDHLKSQLVAPKFDEDRARLEKRLRGDSGLADDTELEKNLADRFGRSARAEASFDVAAADTKKE